MSAEVYLARLKEVAEVSEQERAVVKVLSAAGFGEKLQAQDLVAIKLHVGEKHNITHLKPELAAAAVRFVKKAGGQPFLTDTSTLYKSERDNAVKHTLHAHAHGFGIENTGAPFLPLDGLVGNHEREVRVDGELNQSVKIAGEVMLADALLVLAHATGHMGAGVGASLKTIGMGLASRAGKMRQHSSIQPEVIQGKCTNCGKCRKWCPTDAILEKEDASFIIREKCIGCGECLAVCRFAAVKYNWFIESAILQKSMAEHAAAVVRFFGNKAVYVNVLVDMTVDCDCMNKKQKPLIPDIGILASADMVAADQALLDLTAAAHGKSLSALSFPKIVPDVQLAHAEKLGLGHRKYQLVEV